MKKDIKKEDKIDVSKMSLKELKALCWDEEQKLQQIQLNVKAMRQFIAEKQNEQSSKKLS